MDELQTRHRKEQKDLQGRITQKKKNATKKTRKGVNDECERLERDLKDRQQAEIDALNGTPVEQNFAELQIVDPNTILNGNEAVNEVKTVKFSSSTQEISENEDTTRTKKPNRQKARMARKAAEQEAQIAAAAEEAANQPDLRKQEMKAMDQHKKKLGLTERFIQPNGHCLYSACARGLPAEVVKAPDPSVEGYQNVRNTTANFMIKHRDDFEAFLEEPFDSYVTKVKDTAEWGGQLELQAIARSYNINVKVLRADGRIEEFQPEQSKTEGEDVWLAYYQHSFGLGEHYNALSKVSV